MWKQLLKLRHLASDFLTCKIGSGADCSLWYDVWTLFGKLIDFLGLNGPHLLGISIDAKVSQAAMEDCSRFRGACSNNDEALLSHLTTMQCNPQAIKDCYV